MNMVINQPCYLPWRGYFALIKMADIFIFYDDVPLPYSHGRGRGFHARVELKTKYGRKWLSVPVKRSGKLDQPILDVQIQEESNWQRKHYSMLKDSLSSALYWDSCDPMIREWYSRRWNGLPDLTVNTTLDIARVLDIKRTFLRSSELTIKGGKTERLVAICKAFGATKYIAPRGTVDYLQHELFEDVGIEVEYMDYDNSPYPQQFGEFDPFVTILDLLANVGPDANSHIRAGTIPWRQMVEIRNQTAKSEMNEGSETSANKVEEEES